MPRNLFRRSHEPFGECLACRHFACLPAELAVDLAGGSEEEADRLCTIHRARATEGACVLCGNRFPWVSRRIGSRVGACRPCFVARSGETAAVELEAVWTNFERGAEL